MDLVTVSHGADTAQTPVLIVHGLFGSARNWGAIAKRLSSDRRVLAVDMRNHAGSSWDTVHDYPAMAADLAGVIAAQGAPMDVIGHSMGGKAAMILALTRPDLIRRLIVADIAPVAYAHSQNHLIRAMRAMDLSGLDGRRAADARLAQAITDPGVRAFLLQSLDMRAEPPRWVLNLDGLEAQMDIITGWPDASGLTPCDAPALFLTGALSDYVQPGHRPAIKALFPKARFAKIPNAGHWLHAEDPRAFEGSARVFFG